MNLLEVKFNQSIASSSHSFARNLNWLYSMYQWLMNLFNFLITNYFRIIKFPHYESLHTKVCFLFRGDTASLLLNRCSTEWTEYSEVICSFKKVCFGTFVIESRRNPNILAISILCELVSALWGPQPKLLCWQTSTIRIMLGWFVIRFAQNW